VKYEEIYLRGYANGHEAQRSLTKYFAFYNSKRVHETLEYATPDELYFGGLAKATSAAASRSGDDRQHAHQVDFRGC
jgi:putative transposase